MWKVSKLHRMIAQCQVLPPKLKYYLCYSWGEGAFLALVGRSSTYGVTIKMPYGVDVLHRLALHPIFSYWVG